MFVFQVIPEALAARFGITSEQLRECEVESDAPTRPLAEAATRGRGDAPEVDAIRRVAAQLVERGWLPAARREEFLEAWRTWQTTPATAMRGQPRAKQAEPARQGAVAEDGVPAEWRPGDVLLGLYRVVDLLGQGGMGKVWRVRHAGWEIDLAVKSPRPDLFESPEGKESFVREAETWVELGLHPHVACCYYVRMLGGIPRVFAECVEGGSLGDWIRKGRLYEGGREAALARILDLGVQVAWGLHHAHEHGLVHQDVKPPNVLLTEDGIAKVADFGLSRARRMVGGRGPVAPGQSALVSVGGMTPAYCSPEQAEGLELSRRSDVWSWGLTLVEMLAGEMFWTSGLTALETLARVVSGERAGAPIAAVPEPLVRVLERCFADDPGRRWPDMEAAAAALQGVHRAILGREHARERPRGPGARADALSNRAISLLDLGQAERAESLLVEALRDRPDHPEAAFNLGLLRWRSGRTTDEALLAELDAGSARSSEPGVWTRLRDAIVREQGTASAAARVVDTGGEGDGSSPATGRVVDAGREVDGSAPGAGTGVDTRRERERSAVNAGGWPASGLGGHESAPGAGNVLEPGRAGEVSALAWSRDGVRLAVAAQSGGVVLWNLGSEPAVRDWSDETASVRWLAFSVDGTRLHGWAGVGTRLLWHVSTGRRESVPTPAEEVECAAVSADGSRCVVGSADGTVAVLAPGPGGLLARVWKSKQRGVRALAFADGDRRVLSAGAEAAVRAWDAVTGRRLPGLEGHSGPVNALAASPAGDLVLTGGADGTVRLWEAASDTPIRILHGHRGAVLGVAWAAGARGALSVGADGTLRRWEVATGRCLRTSIAAQGASGRLSVSHEARRAALALSRGRVALESADPCAGPPAAYQLCRPRAATEVMREEEAFRRRLDEADREAAAGRLSSARSRLEEARALPGFEHAPEAVRRLGALVRRGRCRGLRDLQARACPGAEGVAVSRVALAPDGRCGLSAGSDGLIRLWDLERGRCTAVAASPGGAPTLIALAPDGSCCATAAGARVHLLVWPEGREIAELGGHESAIAALFFDPDGRALRSWTADGIVRSWDARSGACLDRRELASVVPGLVAVSPDGALAATPALNRVGVWDLESGTRISESAELAGRVCALAFSRRGDRLLTGDRRGGVAEIRPETGQVASTVSPLTVPVRALAFSWDERWVVALGEDGTVAEWEPGGSKPTRRLLSRTGALGATEFADGAACALAAGTQAGLWLFEPVWDADLEDGVAQDRCAPGASAAGPGAASGLAAASGAAGSARGWATRRRAAWFARLRGAGWGMQRTLPLLGAAGLLTLAALVGGSVLGRARAFCAVAAAACAIPFAASAYFRDHSPMRLPLGAAAGYLLVHLGWLIARAGQLPVRPDSRAGDGSGWRSLVGLLAAVLAWRIWCAVRPAAESVTLDDFTLRDLRYRKRVGGAAVLACGALLAGGLVLAALPSAWAIARVVRWVRASPLDSGSGLAPGRERAIPMIVAAWLLLGAAVDDALGRSHAAGGPLATLAAEIGARQFLAGLAAVLAAMVALPLAAHGAAVRSRVDELLGTLAGEAGAATAALFAERDDALLVGAARALRGQGARGLSALASLAQAACRSELAPEVRQELGFAAKGILRAALSAGGEARRDALGALARLDLPPTVTGDPWLARTVEDLGVDPDPVVRAAAQRARRHLVDTGPRGA